MDDGDVERDATDDLASPVAQARIAVEVKVKWSSSSSPSCARANVASEARSGVEKIEERRMVKYSCRSRF